MWIILCLKTRSRTIVWSSDLCKQYLQSFKRIGSSVTPWVVIVFIVVVSQQ